MEGINATGAAYNQPEIKTEVKPQEKSLLKEESKDSAEFSQKADKAVEKPGFWSCIGNGILGRLKLLVPFYGEYAIGKEYLEQDNAIKDLKDIKEGKDATSEKPGVLKSMLMGFGLAIGYFVPVLGSYLIGHHQIEQDNAVRELNGEETKSAGFFRSVGKGIATKLASIVPVLGTYVIGKEFKEQDNLVEKVNELKGEPEKTEKTAE